MLKASSLFSRGPMALGRVGRNVQKSSSLASARAVDLAPMQHMLQALAIADFPKATRKEFHHGTLMYRDESRSVWRLVNPTVHIPNHPISLGPTTMVHGGVTMWRDEARGVWRL